MDLDAIFFAGDLNARLGNLRDYIDLDEVPTRISIDATENNHGKALREFLVDSKCCVLNGRVTPEFDNPTYVSTRGTSVVDYFVTPHDCIAQVSKCTVDLCSSIITELGIESIISDKCKAPDHSLITVTVQVSPYKHVESRMLGAKNYSKESKHGPKYKVRNLPSDFMKSEQFCTVISDLIDEINVISKLCG